MAKVSKKRAAEVSRAEPESKQLTLAEGVNVRARRRSGGGQGTSAVGGAPGHMGEAAADVVAEGDSMMADGEPDGKGRRRLVRLRKKSITTAIEDQVYHGDEDVQAERGSGQLLGAASVCKSLLDILSVCSKSSGYYSAAHILYSVSSC